MMISIIKKAVLLVLLAVALIAMSGCSSIESLLRSILNIPNNILNSVTMRS